MGTSLPLANAPARGSLLKDRAVGSGGGVGWAAAQMSRSGGTKAVVAAAPEKPALPRGKALRTDRLLGIRFHL